VIVENISKSWFIRQSTRSDDDDCYRQIDHKITDRTVPCMINLMQVCLADRYLFFGVVFLYKN